VGASRIWNHFPSTFMLYSPSVAVDRLSEVLDLIEVRSVVSGGIAAHGRWRSHGVIGDDLKFFAVAGGRARLTTNDAGDPVELVAGDVAVLNGRSWLTLEGGDGPGDPVEVAPAAAGSVLSDADLGSTDAVIGGCIELGPTGKELLLRALPPVAHVPVSSPAGPLIHQHAQRLFAEIVANRVGADFAIRSYGQLLVLEWVRGFMQAEGMPPGWLKVLTDERLRPALALIHEQPAKSWSLDDLARAAAMSRTTFAQRFKETAGTPPLSYLINWRMLLAQRKLRADDTRVGALAFELGYSSESAFSSAFKRHLGESPLAYRTRVRARVPA
jgi:AraC-like DNA-binding protein